MFICVEYRRVWASKPIRYQIFKHHKLCVKLKQIYVSCGELSAIKFIQQMHNNSKCCPAPSANENRWDVLCKNNGNDYETIVNNICC